MKQLSFKKLSMLGLVLIGASAVAAAFTPAKATDSKDFANCNGHIVDSTAPDDGPLDIDRTCTVAVDSANCWTQTGDQDTSTVSEGNVTVTENTQFSHGVVECTIIP